MKRLVIFLLTVMFYQFSIGQTDVPFTPTAKNLQISQPSIKGNVIWVEDSSYTYLGSGTDWILNSKYIVLARNDSGLVTSAKDFSFDTTTNSFYNLDSIWIKYHANGNYYKIMTIPWKASTHQWFDTSKYVLVNEYNKVTIWLNKYWDYENERFTSGSKYKMTYNEDHNPLVDSCFIFDGTTWHRYYILNYYYNADTTRYVLCFWNLNNKVWQKHDSSIIVINAAGNRLYTYSYIWDTLNNVWNKSVKIDYSYDDSNRLIISIRYTWNADSNKWLYSNKWEYVYLADTNLVSSRKYYIWQDTIWVLSSKNTYHYNSNYQVTESDIFYPNSSGDLVIGWKVVYTYDDNGNLIRREEFSRAVDETEFSNYRKKEYYWSQFTLPALVPETNLHLDIYPTITNSMLNISTDQQIIMISADIYSLDGKKIMHKLLKGQNRIDVSALPSGTYLLQLNTSQGLITEKFIKLNK